MHGLVDFQLRSSFQFPLVTCQLDVSGPAPSWTARSVRRVQQIEDAAKRNAGPVWPVVQLVVQLIERLVEDEHFEERVAVRPRRWHEHRAIRRGEVRLEKCRRCGELPDTRPWLEASKLGSPRGCV